MSSLFNFGNVVNLSSIGLSYMLANRGLRQARHQHSASIDLSKRQHLMETFAELAQHFIQLDADLVNATKESERDVYDQRNQQLQTLVLSCTVMFAALSTIMVQGYLVVSSPNALIIGFSICNGLSFACLVGCLVLCIEILALTSRFMICKANYQSKSLWDARKNTEIIFGKLSAKNFNLGDQEDVRFRNLANVEEKDIERLWKELEEGSTKILNDRQKLIGKMVESETFDNFWRNHCDRDRVKAVFLFYSGTVLMLFSIICYTISQFWYGYHSIAGAVSGSVIIFLSLIVAMTQKMTIARLRPESFFFHEGDLAEVALNHYYFRIYFWPESCTWTKCHVITEPEGVHLDEVMRVRMGDDGREEEVYSWKVRAISEDVKPEH
jgi:hypothetical protein